MTDSLPSAEADSALPENGEHLIEREIKLRADGGLDGIRARLEKVGATLVDREHHERNTLFDSAGGELRKEHRVLRLRRAGDRVVLTYKGAPHFEDEIKIRDEIEVALEDEDSAALLLEKLGFSPGARYEKRRESWKLESTIVCLDQTPLGDYVELEGGDIQRVREKLGLSEAPLERRSYPRLWDDHRKEHEGAPESMLFDEEDEADAQEECS